MTSSKAKTPNLFFNFENRTISRKLIKIACGSNHELVEIFTDESSRNNSAKMQKSNLGRGTAGGLLNLQRLTYTMNHNIKR